MKTLLMAAVGCTVMVGCSSHKVDNASVAKSALQAQEAALSEDQRKVLKEWTSNLMTKNSVADIGRLKDSLERWDELFMDLAEPEMRAVFAILKERVRERIAALEAEAGAKAG